MAQRWRTLHGATLGRIVRRTAATSRGGDSLGSSNVTSGNRYVWRYARAVEEGLAARLNGPVRSLADMTAEERAALERQYGAPIKAR